jgi:hypothetical protein
MKDNSSTVIKTRSFSFYASKVIFAVLIIGFFAFRYWSASTLQHNGRITTCSITRKEEYVLMKRENWWHEFDWELDCPSNGAIPFLPRVKASEAKYDASKIGDRIQLRYLHFPMPLLFLGAQEYKLADENKPWIDLSPTQFILIGFGLLLGLATLFRRSFGWLLAVYGLLLLSFYSRPTPAEMPSGPQESTMATVTQLRTVKALNNDTGRRKLDLIQPYQIVTLQFAPRGKEEKILAVDVIDENSVSNVAEKSQLKISYELAHPRTAAIDGAQRTYRLKNLLELVCLTMGFVAIVFVLWLFKRRR